MTDVIVRDRLSAVLKSMAGLVKSDVLVGVPAESTERSGEPINNATLAYIHEHGAPASNIPARPFLIPGVAAVEGKVAAQFKKASTAALSGDTRSIEACLTAAGLIAEASVKKTINDGIDPALAPATVAARRRSRGTQSTREGEAEYLNQIAKGVSAADAQSAAGITPLVNTGKLRNSITHVVRRK